MPGEGLTHGPPAEKNAGGRYHRWCRSAGIPCAMAYALCVLSPGIGCLAPVTGGSSSSPPAWHQRRDARTIRFRRAPRAVRPHDVKPCCDPKRPPHPTPRAVTIAIRPSCRGGTEVEKHHFCKNESGIFLPQDWTGQISLKALTKIVS